MTFVLPEAISLHNYDFDLSPWARGASPVAWNTRNLKVNGGLPITGNSTTSFVNTGATGTEGCFWEYTTSANTFDVSTDTKVLILLHQFNAPNRLEIETIGNAGMTIRSGSGTGSPPTNWIHWNVNGQDVAAGKAREFAVHYVIDLNDTAGADGEVGTYDNTAVETYGITGNTVNMGGTTMMLFLSRMYLFDTVKGGDSSESRTDIPRFTGINSSWDDTITTMGVLYTTKITHGWLAREGTVFSIACPLEFGNNSANTSFDDNGASVFWPDNNDSSDPRIRVTSQAFRVYMNLRNSASDVCRFSGSYDCGNSYPPWDFDQDDNAKVIFSNPTFKRTGTFLMGSSVTGPATFDDCGPVDCVDNGVDLDGSTFKNPNGNHLLILAL